MGGPEQLAGHRHHILVPDIQAVAAQVHAGQDPFHLPGEFAGRRLADLGVPTVELLYTVVDGLRDTGGLVLLGFLFCHTDSNNADFGYILGF